MEHSLILEKVVSGGQTGVDRAALDAALELGFPCGGWCPRGRRSEEGPIAPRYPLEETPSARYIERTRWNARDSDGTLVLTVGEPSGGTQKTVEYATRLGRPCLILDLATGPGIDEVLCWLQERQIKVLNIAGPRESTLPGVYALARAFLDRLLTAVTS